MKFKNTVFEKIVNRKSVFQGKYLALQTLVVKLPDGRLGEREIVRVKDAVAVLPLDNDGNVHLVRQYRAAIDKTLLEIPAGLLNGDESARQAAVRECEEETGYRPRAVTKLITYAHAEGYSTGFMTLYIGTDLEYTGRIHLDSTEFLETVSMPYHELFNMVQENRIMDSKTILCTLMGKSFIMKNVRTIKP